MGCKTNQNAVRMKKLLSVLFLFVFLFAGSRVYAQSTISTFCGVRFGMSKSQVVSVLDSKRQKYNVFPNRLWAMGIYMGPVEFSSGEFNFGNNGLESVIFNLDKKSASFSQSAYDSLLASLIEKYGSPSIHTNNTAKWILSNGRILLRIGKKTWHGMYGESEEWNVFLSYSNKTSNQGNSDL